jgi:hypothetical protein
MKKRFDCVEMKRIGANRLYEELKLMTFEQQIQFWRGRTTALRALREEKRKSGPASI